MSKALSKNKKEQQALAQVPPSVTVGTQVISRDGGIYTITKITKKGEIHLGYKEDDEMHMYGTYESYNELIRRYTILDKSVAEYEEELKQEFLQDFASFKSDEKATSTDVVLMSGKDKALEAERHLTAMTNKLAVLNGMLERKKNELNEIKRGYEDQLKNVTRVVGIIELYLGVHSEIEQIRDGVPAPKDTPISFRQLVLHMDEEVSLIEDVEGGIDSSDIKIFDRYAKKYTDKLLPEQKGVVVLRPRRRAKDYGTDNPFIEAGLNEDNFTTYVLIRNGENLYRIRTEDMNIYPHLFPSEAEMVALNDNESGAHYDIKDREDKQLGYKRNALFLQGLIDRTDIFKPHADGLNIFKPETHGAGLNFVFDATGTLGDGKASYHKWQESLNQQIQRGDRVYYAGGVYNGYSGDHYVRYERELRFPQKTHASSPHKGVYNVKRVETVENTEMLVCHYNPKDMVFNRKYWEADKTRSKAIPFRLYRSDSFIINYEKITIEDIDYYLNDRVNRRHYVDMMPVLKGIRKMLIEEKRWEMGFVEMMVYQTGAREREVIEAVAWWKNKVIEKRPLTKEDAKAVRMIKRYLKSGDTEEGVE